MQRRERSTNVKPRSVPWPVDGETDVVAVDGLELAHVLARSGVGVKPTSLTLLRLDLSGLRSKLPENH